MSQVWEITSEFAVRLIHISFPPHRTAPHRICVRNLNAEITWNHISFRRKPVSLVKKCTICNGTYQNLFRTCVINLKKIGKQMLLVHWTNSDSRFVFKERVREAHRSVSFRLLRHRIRIGKLLRCVDYLICIVGIKNVENSECVDCYLCIDSSCCSASSQFVGKSWQRRQTTRAGRERTCGAYRERLKCRKFESVVSISIKDRIFQLPANV